MNSTPQMQADEYFSAKQIERLYALRAKSQVSELTPEEDAEFTALVEAEFLASAQLTAAPVDALERGRR